MLRASDGDAKQTALLVRPRPFYVPHSAKKGKKRGRGNPVCDARTCFVALVVFSSLFFNWSKVAEMGNSYSVFGTARVRQSATKQEEYVFSLWDCFKISVSAFCVF